MKTRDNFKGDCAPRSGKADRDKLLQQLLDQAQKSNNDKQRKSIVAKIVSIVMRTRPLCRQFNGTPLTGVEREIYDLAEQQLMSSIIQELTQNNALKLANKSRWIIILKLKHLWFKSERYSALRRRSLGSLPSAVTVTPRPQRRSLR